MQKTWPSDCYWQVYSLEVALVVSQRYMAYQVLREKLVVEVSVMSHLVVGCSPVFSCGGVWNHRFSTEANFLTLPVHSPAWCRRSRKACFALRWSPTEPEANCKSDDTLAPGSNWVLHVWWCLIQMQFFRFNMTCTLFYHFQNTQQILWKVMKKKVWKRALDSQVASPGLFKRVTCLALMVSAGSPSETPFQKEKIIFNICVYIHSKYIFYETSWWQKCIYSVMNQAILASYITKPWYLIIWLRFGIFCESYTGVVLQYPYLCSPTRLIFV